MKKLLLWVALAKHCSLLKLVQPLSFSTPCALEQLRCTGMHRLDQEENQTSKNIAQGLSNLGSTSSSTTEGTFP